MKHAKHINLAMIVVAAAMLAAVNAGVWLAAQQGAIPPIGNRLLWTSFVVLNVVSLVWAISLLGLQPLVVAVSYMAGGFLAFKGVQGMSGVSVAEVTTAGATYGAFGALAVCNCMAKVRLPFFKKGQVPFIFIITALLVFDAVLSSGISGAAGNVVLNAVVFPFVLAGVIIGFIWSVIARYEIGQKTASKPRVLAGRNPHPVEAVEEVVEEKEEPNTLKIQMPVFVQPEEEIDEVAATMEQVEFAEAPELPVEETVKVVTEQEEEEFFPLEIDKDNDFIMQEEEIYGALESMAELDGLDEDPYSLTSFDASLYDSDAGVDDLGGVMVDEPSISLSLDIHDEVEADLEEVSASPVNQEPADDELLLRTDTAPVLEMDPEFDAEPVGQAEAESAANVVPEPEDEPIYQTEEEPVSQVNPEPTAKPVVPGEPASKPKSEDWLSSHLDLLNKLK